MATSYHMEALRRQRVIERAVAARRRMEIEFQKMQAPESVDPPSLEPASERSGSRHSQSTRSVSAKSRNSNRTLSHHSRASTAATLTRENQEAPSSRPPSHGSVAVPDSQQLSERPASKSGSVRETNGELKGEGSVQSNRSEKREGESPRAKSREGSKLSKRGTGSAERIGSAEKPKSAADKSVASSKRNSPIPEEVTLEIPVENGKQIERPSSHHSSRKSNRPESHNKATNT